MWWTNGVDRRGRRSWPDVPADAAVACGHRNCRRALVLLPSLEVVVAWNRTRLDRDSWSREETVNDALRRLLAALVE